MTAATPPPPPPIFFIILSCSHFYGVVFQLEKSYKFFKKLVTVMGNEDIRMFIFFSSPGPKTKISLLSVVIVNFFIFSKSLGQFKLTCHKALFGEDDSILFKWNARLFKRGNRGLQCEIFVNEFFAFLNTFT